MGVLLGALSNKDRRGQENREEIGAGAIWFLFFFAALSLVCAPFTRVFAASPLSGAPDKTAMVCRLTRFLLVGVC